MIKHWVDLQLGWMASRGERNSADHRIRRPEVQLIAGSGKRRSSINKRKGVNTIIDDPRALAQAQGPHRELSRVNAAGADVDAIEWAHCFAASICHFGYDAVRLAIYSEIAPENYPRAQPRAVP